VKRDAGDKKAKDRGPNSPKGASTPPDVERTRAPAYSPLRSGDLAEAKQAGGLSERKIGGCRQSIICGGCAGMISPCVAGDGCAPRRSPRFDKGHRAKAKAGIRRYGNQGLVAG